MKAGGISVLEHWERPKHPYLLEHTPLDVRTGAPLAEIARLRPLLSGHPLGLGWQEFFVERLLLPPMEPPPFYRKSCTIVVTLGRSRIAWREGDRWHSATTEPGMICLYPPVVPSHTCWFDALDGLFIHLHPILIERALGSGEESAARIGVSSFDWARAPVYRLVPDGQIYHAALALKAEMEEREESSGKPPGSLFEEPLVAALASRIATRYFTASLLALPPLAPERQPVLRHGSKSELARALEYIQEHLAENLSVPRVAAAAGYSRFHFSRVFKEATGLSPHQYIIQQRVERAKALLERGDLSIGEVAGQVGFDDHSHFTRHFKRVTGSTPHQYRTNANISTKTSE